MITLNFSVDDQLLTRTDENTVAANSHLVHVCEFAFSSEWDNRGKVATFKKRDLVLSVILEDDACTIPPEILQSENKIDVFELSVCGADGNSTITSTVVKVPILAGTWDVMSTEITPTMFEQIMQKIDEVEKGEVSPELIYEAVTEYMEAHPLEPIVAEDVAAYFEEHAAELKGPKGDTGATGATGPQGPKGDTGATPTISAAATVDNTTGTPAVNVTKTGTDAAPEFTFAFSGLKGVNGVNGTPGKSAYQIAIDNGFVGSEQEWLDSLSANASEEVIVDYTDTSYAGISSWPATAITMTATPSNAIFNYTDFTDTQNASQRVFGIASFNVKELLGHGYKIKYVVSNPDYTDESQSYAINSVVLAAAQFNWGTNAVWLHILASEVDQNGENEIDLDAFYSANKATIDSWADVWLLIGQSNKFEAVNGVITGFPATTITVSAKYAIEAEKTAQKSIVCWGDSLTALGGWTTKLAELSGLMVYNGGTGGEDARTIMSRQGGDIMTTNDITIPATATPVNVGYHQGGTVKTELGYYSAPLRGGGSEHVNPVKIGDVEGTLAWTGSYIMDPNGTLTFTRTEAGQAVIIDRPTAIRTAFDRYHNGADNIMIIFMGQNGWGSDDINDLINMHKLMIEHFAGKEFIVLGLSSGSAASRADYEAAMKTAFGRRFISLREYLAHPIYENGQIVSCYGLADQGLTPGSVEYNGVTYVALDEIAQGIVPHQILIDNVHYTEGTKTVIGNMLYKKMQELNILA